MDIVDMWCARELFVLLWARVDYQGDAVHVAAELMLSHSIWSLLALWVSPFLGLHCMICMYISPISAAARNLFLWGVVRNLVLVPTVKF